MIDLERLMKNQDFTVDELKLITYYAVNELAEKENIKIDFRPMTAKDYYESDFFNKYIKLVKGYKKIDLFLAPFKKYAFCFKNTIVVFVDRFDKKDKHNMNHQLVDILHSAFHEVAHVIQREKIDNFSDYENLLFCIEDILIKNNYFHYVNYFDKYFIEASADLYAINKVEEFLCKYPSQNNKSRFYIRELKDSAKLNYDTYDFNFIMSRFHKLRGKETFSGKSNPVSRYLYEKDSNIFVDISKIQTVLGNANNNKCFYSIVSSDVFFDQLDFSSLLESEIDILLKSVKFTYLNECQKKISVKDYYAKYDNLNIFCPEIMVEINYRLSKLEEMMEVLNEKKKKFASIKVKKKTSPYKYKNIN